MSGPQDKQSGVIPMCDSYQCSQRATREFVDPADGETVWASCDDDNHARGFMDDPALSVRYLRKEEEALGS